MNTPPPHHKAAIFAGCLALLAVLGWVDYATGKELGFFVFYSAPVGIAAWYLGRWPAVLVSLAASITWWLADRTAGERYSSQFYFYWNEAIRFGCFVVNAVSIAKVRDALGARKRVDAELAQAREQLHRIAAALTCCPNCKQPYDELARQRSSSNYADLLCDGCRASVRAGHEDSTAPPASSHT